MSILDWLFIALIAVLGVTLVLLLILGATVARPTRWDEAVYDAGRREVERRLIGFGQRSQAELDAASRLIGPVPTDVDRENVDIILDAVMLLSDAPDRSAVELELTALRIRLQASALQRQISLVGGVPSLRIASVLWRGGKLASTGLFALVGFKWFAPRALPVIGRRLQRHAGILGVIGVVVGLGWAGIARISTPPDVPFDWLSAIGSVVVAFSVIGVSAGVLALYKPLLAARFAELGRWTPRDVVHGVMIFLVLVVVVALAMSGVFTDWQNAFVRALRELDASEVVGRWLGAVAITAFVGFMLVNLVRRLRDRNMYLSERLGLLMMLPVVLMLPVILINYALDQSFISVSTLVLPTGYWMVLFGGASGVVAAVEWNGKYRTLKRFGYSVPRKGFRWWALIAWAISGLLVLFLSPVLASVAVSDWSSAWFVVADVAVGLLGLFWALSVVPLATVTWLYVRRVARSYDRLRHQLAEPHIAGAPDD